MFNTIEKLEIIWQRMWKWWHIKYPVEKWDFIIKVAKIAGDLIGARMFGDIKKVNLYSGMCAFVILTFFSTTFYTIQYYLLRGELVRGMECTYVAGVVIAVRMRNFLCFELAE